MIFILKRPKSLFFSSLIMIIFLISNIIENVQIVRMPLVAIIYFFIAIIYLIALSKSYLAHNSYISSFLVLLFTFIFIPKEIDYTFLFINLLISIIYLFYLNQDNSTKLTYFNLGLILLISNYLYFETVSFTVSLIFYTFIYSKSFLNRLLQLFFGLFISLLILLQFSYLMDFNSEILTYFDNIKFISPSFSKTHYFLFPILIIFIYSIIEGFININKQNFLKKHENNKFMIFIIFSLFISLFLTKNHSLFFNLILFPLSIYLGRFIYYQKRWYVQELIIWIIIFMLFMYKYYKI